MKHRIYLASSWRNTAQVQPGLVETLRSAGHEVYDFRNPAPGKSGFAWSAIDPAWQTWTAEEQLVALEHPIARHGLALDFCGMTWATAFVMLQPFGRSAALELGWAIGAGKHTAVLMVNGQEPELMIRLAELLTTSVGALLVWLNETASGRARVR